ncbi:unnamed protein product [Callosobruchus maculatus]|uniref:Uncharacterized protein n=1 Tax=Callosobruchus maculatus TaxID=64391 RepID=A0A653BX04_CALMS|nr:unnamed protein product [Callosobruchus maculatus]VEN39477.1 unnamed protein product [Callosobruchus maculatus]
MVLISTINRKSLQAKGVSKVWKQAMKALVTMGHQAVAMQAKLLSSRLSTDGPTRNITNDG